VRRDQSSKTTVYYCCRACNAGIRLRCSYLQRLCTAWPCCLLNFLSVTVLKDASTFMDGLWLLSRSAYTHMATFTRFKSHSDMEPL
jgi:hypothetical protein